ncbi:MULTISPECIES: hypothetical protein [unclassified Microbacterium]|uniref:hypothetical protein n=1 Tax=unclassified Microbacterium TaxID=2609290 RepID=UPI00214AD8BB|nr:MULTISPECIES: hypothetical protein [unclassified Microbacterium]MCR2785373.1 hypothetical protein [Microbacterium sp. zg.B96]WIM16898.1 hypothetical protein QNO11_04445 [Microbacterium sp. zg-B96]
MTITAARTQASPARPDKALPARRWLTPAIILVLAAVAWAVALPSLRDAPWNLFGLLAAASPLFPVSVVLATIAFCLAIALRATRTAGIALVSTILMMRLPTAISTDAPLYSWTYKHFGPIDYIQRFGAVDVDIDIYHNWPGAFSFIAWLNTVTGTETLAIAQWFAVGSQLAVAAAVFFLARTYGQSTATALVAAFCAHAVNWVAQDYLSPQAIGFALAIVVVALVLASVRTRAAAWVAVPIFTAIVVTHQLTPYWLLAAVFLLTVLGRVRPKYLIVVFAAIAIGYMLLHMNVLSQFGRLLNFDFLSNIMTPSARNETLGNPSVGQVVNSWAARGVTLLVWISAGIVTLVRLLRHRDQWRNTLVPAVVAFSPALILVAQGYGGEALFRVFLYSIPGCMLILAPGLTRLLRGEVLRARRAAQIGVTAIASLTALASMQAYYGGWFANLVTPESVQLTTRVLQEEDPSTLTIGVAPGAPGRLVAEYVDFVQADELFDSGIDMWLTSWPGWETEQFADPRRVTRLTDSLVWEQRPALVVITQQMRDYSTYYGTLPDGALDRFESILEDDPRWVLDHESEDTLVYRLDLGTSRQG